MLIHDGLMCSFAVNGSLSSHRVALFRAAVLAAERAKDSLGYIFSWIF